MFFHLFVAFWCSKRSSASYAKFKVKESASNDKESKIIGWHLWRSDSIFISIFYLSTICVLYVIDQMSPFFQQWIVHIIHRSAGTNFQWNYNIRFKGWQNVGKTTEMWESVWNEMNEEKKRKNYVQVFPLYLILICWWTTVFHCKLNLGCSKLFFASIHASNLCFFPFTY